MPALLSIPQTASRGYKEILIRQATKENGRINSTNRERGLWLLKVKFASLVDEAATPNELDVDGLTLVGNVCVRFSSWAFDAVDVNYLWVKPQTVDVTSFHRSVNLLAGSLVVVGG